MGYVMTSVPYPSNLRTESIPVHKGNKHPKPYCTSFRSFGTASQSLKNCSPLLFNLASFFLGNSAAKALLNAFSHAKALANARRPIRAKLCHQFEIRQDVSERKARHFAEFGRNCSEWALNPVHVQEVLLQPAALPSSWQDPSPFQRSKEHDIAVVFYALQSPDEYQNRTPRDNPLQRPMITPTC